MYLPTQNIFKRNHATPFNKTKCRILTSVRKQILIHKNKVFKKPYFKRYRIKNMEIWLTFFNRRNSVEVFGDCKACSEVLKWNIDGLYILTTRAHSYFVNISILYVISTFIYHDLVSHAFRRFEIETPHVGEQKPRMWPCTRCVCTFSMNFSKDAQAISKSYMHNLVVALSLSMRQVLS
jgi:hypothetical protein